DHWAVQTIGLLQVALACVMAGGAVFGMLLFAYFGCFLWCLSLLQLYGAQVRAEASARMAYFRLPIADCRLQIADCRLKNQSAICNVQSRIRPGRVPWRLLGLGRATRWALLGGALGLLLFLGIPRQTDSVWNAEQLFASNDQQLRTGFSGEIDLNRTGAVLV